jgi:preprotein translocase subunit SecE
MISKIKNYVREVKTEMKSVSWPNRNELISATMIVILSTALLAFFIGVVDFALSTIIKILLR